jgi:hypothetical protein
MSVTVRPFRAGGWEVDIRWRTPQNERVRERRVLKVSSKSAAKRWGENRERELLLNGPGTKPKEVPTFDEFAPLFVQGHAVANRQKPSGIAHKEGVLRTHLIPFLGKKKLDAITNEDVQRLKSRLHARSPKTVNNVLTVLNTMLKKAVEWAVLDRTPCVVRLLKVSQANVDFYDFDEFEKFLAAAAAISGQAHLIALLGGRWACDPARCGR